MKAAPPFDDGASSPLSGLKVLDLTRLAAGNMLTHMLADFGADVVKVERPGVGDDLRRFGKHESWWKEYSRSKRSLSLNPRSEEGQKVLLKLVETADVFAENSVPGTREKRGSVPDVLMSVNPDLVIVRVSGWGQTGPNSRPSWPVFLPSARCLKTSPISKNARSPLGRSAISLI